MDKQLPKNWVETDVETVTSILDNMRKPVSADERSKRLGNVPYYGATGQAGLIDDFIFNEELILVGEDGAPFFDKFKNVAYLINGKSWVNNHAHVLKGKENILENKFLLHFFNQFDYTNYVGGTTRLKLNQASLKSIPFPLPPLPEQNRIVEKLEALFAQLETIKASMVNIPLLLKDFRQQVLTQAFTGKLTEEWRKGKELESGEDLLKKIKTKRLEIYRNQCLEALKNGKRKPKQPILEIIDDNKRNFVIPDNWIYCTIGDVGDVSNGSTPSRPISEYWNGNIPWISSGLVRNNRISVANEHLTELGFENSSVRLLPKGSVLLAMIGEGKTRGQSSILDIDATINQNVAGISIEHGLVVSEYLQNWLFVNYESNREMGNGTGPQALNCQKVRELPFVLPSYLEQQEIVTRVESLFAKADAIEQQYKSLKEKIDTLPQALLHKAFKGELTEQLESDGDAKELLKQIQELKTPTKVVKNEKLEKLKSFNKKIKNYPKSEGVLGMVAEGK